MHSVKKLFQFSSTMELDHVLQASNARPGHGYSQRTILCADQGCQMVISCVNFRIYET